MPITTRAGARSGLQWPRPFTKVGPTPQSGKWGTAWASVGSPSAGSYSTTLAGSTLSGSVSGALPLTSPTTGNSYLSLLMGSFQQTGGSGGALLLCDRLWHNGGLTITSTTAQTINSGLFPARDNNGTTNGEGVKLALEVSANCGAAAPTITVSYTNEVGTAGRTATNYLATANSPNAGTVYPIGLQAGDRGVREVGSLTLSASWVSGTVNLVAYRVIGVLNLQATGRMFVSEEMCGFQRIFNDSVLYFMLTGPGNSNFVIAGSTAWSQG